MFHVIVDGKEKAISKADLIRTIKIGLPQREPQEAPTPLFDLAEGNGR